MTDTEKMDVILEKVVFIGNKVDSMDVRLGRVEEKVDSMDIRLGKVEERVGEVEKKVNSMDVRLGKVEEKVDSMDARLGKVEERVDSMDARLGKVEERVGSMDGRLTRVEKGVIDVKNEIVIVRCIMENELDHNIKLIAEGHYDLNRKLDKALHLVGDVQAKEEVQDVLLTLHEAKLKELSGRLDLYAG